MEFTQVPPRLKERVPTLKRKDRDANEARIEDETWAEDPSGHETDQEEGIEEDENDGQSELTARCLTAATRHCRQTNQVRLHKTRSIIDY